MTYFETANLPFVFFEAWSFETTVLHRSVEMFASVARSVSKNKTSSGRRNQKLLTHLASLVFSDSHPRFPRFHHGGCSVLCLHHSYLVERTSVCPPPLLSIALGFVLGIPMWILTCFPNYLTPGLAFCTRLTYFILPVLSTPRCGLSDFLSCPFAL